MSIDTHAAFAATMREYRQAIEAQFASTTDGVMNAILIASRKRADEDRRLTIAIGPVHRPGRDELCRVWRVQAKAACLRRNLPRLGQPAGEFRRAS